ncbi:MAG: aldehyde dehydrogenase family protein [Anaerolineales bacterium]
MSIADIFQNMIYGPAPESPAAADAWLDEHGRNFGLFINNQFVAPQSGRTLPTLNPARGEKLADVADAGEADIHAAYEAARAALPAWQALSGHARARFLYAIARHLQKHQRLLAVVESMDNGKLIRESRDLDIPLTIRHFYHHVGWAQLMDTEMRDYQPVGVVGQIIPWNFPLLMLAWKIAPALAMGNTVVLKPAPYTPLSALLFGEILAEAGLPPGVVNIVTGGDEAGAAITSHPGFDKIAFTGSTQVGRIIRRVTAGTGKKLSLELGGKSPFVVFEDADQEAAIEGLVDAIWFNQGQVCCAGSRLLVQESIAERFMARVKQRMGALRVGDSLDKGYDIGAIIDPVQYETIDTWVKRGVDEGAELYQPEIDMPAQGCFYPPTLLSNVEPSSSVGQEEIFGPVIVAMTFRTPQEAVELANNTRYGLAASVWSENLNTALDIAGQIKAGSVWVNCTNMFDGAAGFGGYRESGFGREGGQEGLYEYARPTWEARPQPDIPERAKENWGDAIPARPLPLNGKPQARNGALPPIDRTAKLYIGGKQARPDGNYSRVVCTAEGDILGQVGDGNRKDIRDAVEAAAQAAPGWASKTGHSRAQILYYLAENLAARQDEFVARLVALMGISEEVATQEAEKAAERLFTYGAYADKFGGNIQETNLRGLTLAVNEPLGIIGMACPDEYPLLAMVSLVGPAVARGNATVVIPSQPYPLIATDFYQILDTSDVPPGVINIVTGDRDHLSKTLAEHDEVDALWYFGDAVGSYHVEYRSAGNMKRTWVSYGEARNWLDDTQGAGREFLREATQVKNIWVPTGA